MLRADCASRRLAVAFLLALLSVTPVSAALSIGDVDRDPGEFRRYETVDDLTVMLEAGTFQRTRWAFVEVPDCVETRMVLADPATAPDWPVFQALGADHAVEVTRDCEPCIDYGYFAETPFDLRQHGEFLDANADMEPTCGAPSRRVFDGLLEFGRPLVIDAVIGDRWTDAYFDDSEPGAVGQEVHEIVAEGVVQVPAGLFEAIVIRSDLFLDLDPLGFDDGEDVGQVVYTWWSEQVGTVAELRGPSNDRSPFFDVASRAAFLQSASMPLVSIESVPENPGTLGTRSEFIVAEGRSIRIDLEPPFAYAGAGFDDVVQTDIVDPATDILAGFYAADYPMATRAALSSGVLSGRLWLDYFSFDETALFNWGSVADFQLVPPARQIIIDPAAVERQLLFPLSPDTLPWMDAHDLPSRVLDAGSPPLDYVVTTDKQVVASGFYDPMVGGPAMVTVVREHLSGALFDGVNAVELVDQYVFRYVAPRDGTVAMVITQRDVGGTVPLHGDLVIGAEIWRRTTLDPATAAAPGDVQLAMLGSCQEVDVIWENTNEPGVGLYDVQHDAAPSFPAPVTIEDVPDSGGASTSARINGLIPGQQRFVRVRADDNSGVDGEWSNVLRVSPDAGVAPFFAGVTSVVPALDCNELVVSWSPAIDNCAGSILYQVFVREQGDPQRLDIPDVEVVDATMATVPGLNPGTTYCVVVRARDFAGNVDDNVVEMCASPGQPLAVAGTLLQLTRDSASAATGLTLDYTVNAGDGAVNGINFLFPEDFVIRPFTDDADGVLGTFSVDPPGITADIIVLGSANAFVDIDGNGFFTGGVDHVLAVVEEDIFLRLFNPETIQGTTTTYRLELNSSLITNPGAAADYDITAQFISDCSDQQEEVVTVTVDPPGCVPVLEVGVTGPSVRLRKQITGRVVITWDPPPLDPCFRSYGVYATDDVRLVSPAVVQQFAERWTNIASDDADGDATNEVWTGQPNQTFFLITLVGPEGEVGAVGHYDL